LYVLLLSSFVFFSWTWHKENHWIITQIILLGVPSSTKRTGDVNLSFDNLVVLVFAVENQDRLA